MKKTLSMVFILVGILGITVVRADFMSITSLDFKASTYDGPLQIEERYVFTTDTTGSVSFQAKPLLHHGDIINSASFIGRNSTGSGATIQASLTRWQFDGGTNSVHASSSTNEGFFNKPMTGTLSFPHTVDLEHYTYGLTLTFSNSPGTDYLSAQAVILNYTPSPGAVMPALSATSIAIIALAISIMMLLGRRRFMKRSSRAVKA